MLIWNVKDSVLKAAKTENLYFSLGDEVPEEELAPGRKESFLAAGCLKEGEAQAKKAPEKPLLPPPGPKPEPPEEAESTPAPAAKKSKKKGKK
jgi:hypothetical protein